RAALPPTMPFTSQVSAVPGATHSTAVKNCVSPAVTIADKGAIEFGAAQETVTLADADLDGSTTLVATTVTALLGGTGGAVYVAVSSPMTVSVPVAASPLVSPPPATLRLQLTAGFPPPLTVALKVCVPPGVTCAAFGAMFTVIPL